MMKRSRFTEEEIIEILRGPRSGVSATDVCRKHGISKATLNPWKVKFGGLQSSDAERLKKLG